MCTVDVFSDLSLFFVHINLHSMPVMAERTWEAYLNYSVRQRLYSKKNGIRGSETTDPENSYV